MLVIEDNKIYLTRGNTAIIDIALTKNGEPYTMVEGDSLVMTIKRKYPYNKIVLTLLAINSSFVFGVDATKDMAFGIYDYDITFYGNDGAVDTVIVGEFEVGKECYDNES